MQVLLYMIQVYWFYLICIAMQRAILGKSTKDLETDLKDEPKKQTNKVE